MGQGALSGCRDRWVGFSALFMETVAAGCSVSFSLILAFSRWEKEQRPHPVAFPKLLLRIQRQWTRPRREQELSLPAGEGKG